MGARMANHLFDLIRKAMPAQDKVFLHLPDGSTMSYGDFLAGTGRYANTLRALGVKPGDRVAIQVEKSPETLLLILGCVRAGAVMLPLNTAYTTNELAYFIGDAEPALVVCDPSKADALTPVAAQAGAKVETLDAKGQGSLAEKTKAASSDDRYATRPATSSGLPRRAIGICGMIFESSTSCGISITILVPM